MLYRLLAVVVAAFAVLFVYGAMYPVSPWHADMFARGAIIVYCLRAVHELWHRFNAEHTV